MELIVCSDNNYNQTKQCNNKIPQFENKFSNRIFFTDAHKIQMNLPNKTTSRLKIKINKNFKNISDCILSHAMDQYSTKLTLALPTIFTDFELFCCFFVFHSVSCFCDVFLVFCWFGLLTTYRNETKLMYQIFEMRFSAFCALCVKTTEWRMHKRQTTTK